MKTSNKINRLLALLTFCIVQYFASSQTDILGDSLTLKLDLLFKENASIPIEDISKSNEYWNLEVGLKLAKMEGYRINKIGLVCFTSPVENVEEADTSLNLNKNRIIATDEYLKKLFESIGYEYSDALTDIRVPLFDEESKLLIKLMDQFGFKEKDLIKRVLPAFPDKRGTNLELINYSKTNVVLKHILTLMCRVSIEIEISR